MIFCEPKYFKDEPFAVRSYEAGVTDHVALPTLCNYMQEIAGHNADELGWGIKTLQSKGITWMLSHLHVKVSRYVPWGETVNMRTWPSGMKGRLIAKRCFQAADSSGGRLLEAHSEWLYVDMNAQKIVRLPETFSELVPPGTPGVEFTDIGGKSPAFPSITHSAEILVRRSDLDFNDHVNNVHYVEWMLEAMPGSDRPAEMDIVFHKAAKAGDVLVSEVFADGARTCHRIRRPSDDAVLATAVMMWPVPRRVVICLGSNIEPRLEYLDRAQAALAALPDTRLDRESETEETEPVDVPEEFASQKFLNRILVFETSLSPEEFAHEMHKIEDSLGRERGPVRNAPRTIDIDMIDYEGVVSNDPVLTLPHPRASSRSFVSAPLVRMGISLSSDDLLSVQNDRPDSPPSPAD